MPTKYYPCTNCVWFKYMNESTADEHIAKEIVRRENEASISEPSPDSTSIF